MNTRARGRSGRATFDRTRNEKVTARRYNLLLNSSRFSSYEDAVPDWVCLVTAEACKLGMKVDLDPGPPRVSKSWSLDTAARNLRGNGLSLRVNDEGVQDKRYRIDLSKDHWDRHLAAMAPINGRGRSSNEFIEVIRPGGARYVKSSFVWRNKVPQIRIWDDVTRLYPGTAELAGVMDVEAMKTVDDATTWDLHETIGRGTYGACPPVSLDIKASFTGIWRLGRRIDTELQRHMPDAVEFVFGYESLPSDGGLEGFSCDNVLLGAALLESLSTKHDWLDHSG